MEMGVPAHCFHELVLAEGRIARAFHLVKSVGEKQHQVAAGQRPGGRGIRGVLEQTERGAGLPVGVFQNLHFAATAVDQKRPRMAGIGISNLPRFQIRHQIKRGGEKRGAGLLQNGAQIVVDSCQQLARFLRHGAQFLHQRAQHGRDQGRADAVPHHVTDKQAGLVGRQRQHIEKVPSHLAGGLIAVPKQEQTLVRRGA